MKSNPMQMLFKDNLQGKTLRRLLRSRSTQAYFSHGGWTSSPEEAEGFPGAMEAAQSCARYGLNDMELVLRVEDSQLDAFCAPL
jgi:hypothetical protein